MDELTKEVLRLKGLSLNNTEIAEYLIRNDLVINLGKADSIRRTVSRIVAKNTEKEIEPKQIIEEKKEEVIKICQNVGNEYETTWTGDKIIRFGLVSDTHINSKYTQLSQLHEAYITFGREGIDKVYHCGDIGEGDQMRMGHQYECYAHGADDQRNEIVKVYPKINGITTEFITGNHDHSFIKRQGYDIGKAISIDRPDMIYLGQAQAFVNLTPNCKLELRHPEDGTAYAISYKLQKMVEAMSGGEKPNILAVGHYHKSEYLCYRNVQCVQAGTLQSQTPWERGKGISVAVGYWIIEIHVNDDGQINTFKPSFMPFYKSIKDDYRSFDKIR